MRVGVLALQGDVREHAAAIERAGGKAEPIRSAEQLESVSALVLPGGESTTMSLLMDRTGLRHSLERWTADGKPTLGTCAGLVLLADRVLDGRADRPGIGGLDVTVRRNGHGRQLDSFEAELDAPGVGGTMLAVFIRAPRITQVGDGVEVLAALDHADGPEPVVVRSGRIIGCASHPELAGDDRLHEMLMASAS